MTTGFFFALWLIVYWYFVERNGDLQKGVGRRIAALVMAACALAAGQMIPLLSDLSQGVRPDRLSAGTGPGHFLGWLAVSGIFLLFDLFFDREAFRHQWLPVLLPGLATAALSALAPQQYILVNGPLLFLYFALLAHRRDYLRLSNGITMAGVYLLLSLMAVLVSDQEAASLLRLLILALEILTLLLAENTLFACKRSFEVRTETFQQELLGHQYDEIKTIYLNMRGWRHDYHNHLQVLKAHLAAGKPEEANVYLDELEQDLDRVDTYIKSGNLMIDAILNSKLSLAGQRRIAVNCKVQAPPQLSVEDVDLCVILGNLLDNAMEACDQIPEHQRFLRIYLAVHQSQLYLSIQNSAREELNFNERNYITGKRGSHGFGMRRVQAVVDKYEGFLNLANEPGIFAAEVTLPLSDCNS